MYTAHTLPLQSANRNYPLRRVSCVLAARWFLYVRQLSLVNSRAQFLRPKSALLATQFRLPADTRGVTHHIFVVQQAQHVPLGSRECAFRNLLKFLSLTAGICES